MPTDIYVHDTYFVVFHPLPFGKFLPIIAVAAIAGFVWFFFFWFRQRRP